MFVACPACQSLFQIGPAHLRAAGGRVHCGVCQHRFDATAGVFDDGAQALAWASQHVAREIDELVDRALDQVPGAEAFLDAGEDEAAPAAAPATAHDNRYFHADADFYAQPMAEENFPDPAPPAAPDPAPSPALYAEDFDATAQGTDWRSIVLALLLTVLLLGQYAFVERNRLAAFPQLRPALEIFCTLARCDLPLRREPGKVEMVEREVTDHPNVADALLINATFVNRAAFPQAYPLFQISFSDVAGTPIALRRFRPEEYLDAGKDASAGMVPGEQTHLMLEVVDPGEKAVSFQFDFL